MPSPGARFVRHVFRPSTLIWAFVSAEFRAHLAEIFYTGRGIWPRRQGFTDRLVCAISRLCYCWKWLIWSILASIVLTIVAIAVSARTGEWRFATILGSCAWMPSLLFFSILLRSIMVIRWEYRLAWASEWMWEETVEEATAARLMLDYRLEQAAQRASEAELATLERAHLRQATGTPDMEI